MLHNCGINENGNCVKNAEFNSDAFCGRTEKKRCKMMDRVKRYKHDIKLFFTDIFKQKLAYYDKTSPCIDMNQLFASLPDKRYISIFERFPYFIQEGIKKTFLRYVQRYGTTKQKSLETMTRTIHNMIENDYFSNLDQQDKNMLTKLHEKLLQKKRLTSPIVSSSRVLPSFIVNCGDKKERIERYRKEECETKRYINQRKLIVERLKMKEMEEKRKEDQTIAEYIQQKQNEMRQKEDEKQKQSISSEKLKSPIHPLSRESSIPDTLSVCTEYGENVSISGSLYADDIPSSLSDFGSVLDEDITSNSEKKIQITRTFCGESENQTYKELKEALFDDNVRILSVRQPWAWAIVNGYKTIENRKSTFPSTLPLPRWVVIHASQTQYTKSVFEREMKLLRSELVKAGFQSVNVPNKECFRYGQVVGMAKFIRSGTKPLDIQNVWWHKDTYAYDIGSSARYSNTLFAKGQLGFGKLIHQPNVLCTLRDSFRSPILDTKNK